MLNESTQPTQNTQHSALSTQHFLFSRLLSIALSIYALCLIVYGLLRLLTGDTLNLIRILDNFAELLMLPALVLLPLTLLLRRWRVAVLLTPIVIACLLLYGGLFIPRTAAQSEPDLTLLTYNLRGGNPAFDAITQTIRSADADVVVVQELWPNAKRVLSQDLAGDYPYMFLNPYQTDGDTYRLGLGVFSRYPILTNNFDAYQPESSKLSFQIEINGKRVTIYAVHLANPLIAADFDPKAHGEGITGLLDLLATESTPLIVAGDFNMTDISVDYGRMTAKLVDSFRESGSGFGFTFPAWSPIGARIDYVFHSSGVRSLKTEVMSSSGNSDHFPVRAELMIDQVAVTPSP